MICFEMRLQKYYLFSTFQNISDLYLRYLRFICGIMNYNPKCKNTLGEQIIMQYLM